MNVGYSREIYDKFGLGAAVHDAVVRAMNRFAEVQVLKAMSLTHETVDAGSLAPTPGFTWGFVDRKALLARVRAQPTDMTEAFVDEACARGDLCFGAMEGETLAGYGWYSTRPTPITDALDLHFDPSYAYMYKGFTLPAYRGQRLHGAGMARAMEELVKRGQKGLVSYVRSNNFASLKSCYRLGYRDFGEVLVVSPRGARPFAFATPGCKRFDFRVEPHVDAAPAVAANTNAPRPSADAA